MKAFTAVAMEKSTAEVGDISKAETPGIELVPNLIKFGGGIPIKNSKGQILGGIGVSGASKKTTQPAHRPDWMRSRPCSTDEHTSATPSLTVPPVETQTALQTRFEV